MGRQERLLPTGCLVVSALPGSIQPRLLPAPGLHRNASCVSPSTLAGKRALRSRLRLGVAARGDVGRPAPWGNLHDGRYFHFDSTGGPGGRPEALAFHSGAPLVPHVLPAAR